MSGQTVTWCHKDGVKVGMVQAMAKDGDRPQSLARQRPGVTKMWAMWSGTDASYGEGTGNNDPVWPN